MINLINAKSYDRTLHPVISIDRETGLGNPFFMAREDLRDNVCNQYDSYFHNNLIMNFRRGIEAPRRGFYHDLLSLAKKIRAHPNVFIKCWCVPRRCHGETIVRFFETELKQLQPMKGYEPEYHAAKDGTIFELHELDDSHLCNIIARMRTTARQGIMVGYSGGCPGSYNDDVDCFIGGDALDYLGYAGYWNEYLKRLKG